MPTLGAFTFTFTLDGATQNHWVLVDAVLDEAVGELPLGVFEVLMPEALSGSPIARALEFVLLRGPEGEEGSTELTFKGFIARAELLPREPNGQHRARLHVTHKAHGLSLARRYRIFEDKTVSDVMTSVAGEGGLSNNIMATHVVAAHRTQYAETDLDLLRRLAEDSGSVLRFDRDEPSKLTTFLGDAKTLPLVGTFALVYGEAAVADVEAVQRFSLEHRGVAPSRAVKGWKPGSKDVASVTVHAVAPRSFFSTTQDLDVLSARNPNLIGDMDAVRHNAKGTHTVDDAAQHIGRGESNVLAFAAARRFKLDDQTDSGLGGEWALLRVQHRITLRDDGEGPIAMVYENDFECALTTVPCRPPRSVARPLALAPQIGIVTDIPSTGNKHKNHFAVRVMLPVFSAAHQTAWLHIAQPFAGNDHGIQFLPHVDDQVLVAFVNGDPDHPVVVGSMYNGVDKPPATMPRDYTRSVIRATPYENGGKGPDEVYFEEAADAQVLGINAAKDHKVVVGNDNTHDVKHDRITKVENDEKLTVVGNRTTVVEKVDKTTVEQNQELVVKQDAKTTVYQKFTLSADTGVVIQCGDSKIELTPLGITLSNSTGAKVELMGGLVSITNGQGAKVELMGPMVNLN
jgi:type VI secretion system secreted protein VgrG